MSLFVLREGFQIVTSLPGAARIVHLRTGDSLEVSEEHARALEGASGFGLDPADPWLAEVVQKYRDLGLLVPAQLAPTAAPEAAVAPAIVPLVSAPAATGEGPSLEDPIPLFLDYLEVIPEVGSSLIKVHDPKTGKTFQLYDFEIALARMLDGRRRYFEVVESAQRLGLPVNFVSLVQFVRQLGRYGFLAPVTHAPRAAPKTEASSRASAGWDEATRTLFESGLRMHRQGRYPESAAYFEAILVQDPRNAEVLQLLAEANERIAHPPTPSLPSLPPPHSPVLERFDALSLDDAPVPPELPRRTLSLAPVGPTAPPPIPPAIPPLVPLEPPAPLESRPARRFPTLPVAVLAAIVLGVGGWAIFARSKPVAPVVVLPAPVAAVAVDAGAKRVEIEVAESAVHSTVIVAAVDAGAVEAGAVEAGAVEAAPVDAGGVEAVAAPVDAGETPANDASRRWLVAKINKRGRVTMGQVLAAADGSVAWKVTPEQQVKKGARIATLHSAGGETKLLAPVSGLVIQKVAEGANSQANEVVAAILYPEGFLQTIVTGAQPAPGWSCEVVDEAAHERADCVVVSATPRGDGFFVTATVVPRWFDAAPAPLLRVAPP